MNPRSKFFKCLLVCLPISLIILSFGTSKTFDAALTSSMDFIQGLSPIYYLTYFFVIGILLYFGYLLFVENKGPFGIEHLNLFYVLLFAFLTLFPLLLFTHPLATEAQRYEKVFHVLNQGTLKGLPPHPSSIGMAILGSSFISITSLDGLLVVKYVIPIFLGTLTAFLLYVVAHSVGGWKLASFGALFAWGGLYFPFHVSRYSFAAPLFVLFIGLFSRRLSLRQGETGISISFLILLLLGALVVSHPAHSLLSVFAVIVSLSILLLYGKIAKVKSHFRIGMRLKVIAVFGGVVWLSWFLLKAHMLWGYLRLTYLWDVFIQGITPTAAMYAHPTTLEPIYQIVTYGRLIIGPILLIAPLALFLYLFYRYRNKIMKALDSRTIAFLGIYIFFSFVAFLAFVNSTSAILRVEQIMFLMAPIPLILIVKHLPQKKKIFKFLLALIGIGLISITFLIWIPNITYMQVPSKQAEMARNFSEHSPHMPQVEGVGMHFIQNALFRYMYGARADISVHKGIDPENLTAVKKSKVESHYILINGAAVNRETKFSFEPPLWVRLELIQANLEDNGLNKIYANGNLYSIWSTKG